ncbi:MAG: ATP-binding protein [Candidatus Methanoplasma sp.]|nr:ATP-binding protein [Candidatus Methanoplasma sp.]
MPRSRDLYMNKLKLARDEPFIKIITGVRRCGKSTLLDLFEAYLLGSGVDRSNIVRLNLDSRLLRTSVRDGDALYDVVRSSMGPGRNYVLLDEIQNARDWEGGLISMYTDLDADIYVTGSNAVMQSPDIEAKLVGRYIEIHVLPLSFSEYLDFTGEAGDKGRAFEDYMKYGGFPAVALTKPELRNTVMDGIYMTVLDLDVGVKNGIKDGALLRDLAEYLMDNVGNTVSAKGISDYLSSGGRANSHTTIGNYLAMMERAFLLYRAPRYDVRGKVRLKTLGKYYVVDTGFRDLRIRPWSYDRGRVLENVAYLELVRRGYSVDVGKVGIWEVDFIARKAKETIYVQVTYSMADPATAEREMRPLMRIEDNHRKLVLCMDRFDGDHMGIEVKNIVEWLLSD